MATSKHIGLICLSATLLTVLLTVLFMNGEALGLQVLSSQEELFTAEELEGNWDSTDATRIVLQGDGGTVTGNGAYFSQGDLHIVYAGRYVLSGTLSEGSVIVHADGDDEIWLLLDGVSLCCQDNAALWVQKAGAVYLTLAQGSENRITTGDGESDHRSSGIDGAVYSRDDLTINGSGALQVSSGYGHGIVCNDTLKITQGVLTVEAPQDAIHANDAVKLTRAEVRLSAGDDGIHVGNDTETSCFYMDSGSLTVSSCYEGVEATQVTVAGGSISIVSTDDGINACGRGDNALIEILGGDIRIVNRTGRDADGMDSNGSVAIRGGCVFISVSGSGGSCAIDYGSENRGTCVIDGGTVIACGSSSLWEEISADSAQAFLTTRVDGAAGAVLRLADADGTTLLEETIPAEFSLVTLSTPELQWGDRCILSVDEKSQTVTVEAASFSGDRFPGGDVRGREQDPMTPGGWDQRGGRGEEPAFRGQEPPQTAGQEPPELPGGGEPGERSGFQSGRAEITPSDRQQLLLNLLPVGLSALALLMGLLFAWKKKI